MLLDDSRLSSLNENDINLRDTRLMSKIDMDESDINIRDTRLLSKIDINDDDFDDFVRSTSVILDEFEFLERR